MFALYDYKEIRTPIFESTELFTRSIGGSTDIVSKEMYEFKDRKGRSLTLRPEETAPVVRAGLENNLIGQDQITKLYYIGPMFRYERPQAGRQRQFHQAGVEVFGSSDPLIDAEVILLNLQLFREIGLKDLAVNINSVGDEKCRPEFRKRLKAYFKDNIKIMCPDCKERLEANPLRILDCKEEKCQEYIEGAPASVDTLCDECKDHFEAVINRPPLIVIGDRNIRRFAQPFSKEPGRRNASISDRGNLRTSMTGTIRLRATFQNGVCGKCSRQKACQRSIVRQSAPVSRDSSRTRCGVAPCRMAAIKITIALK